MVYYSVQSARAITNVIIPHFDKYPLITQKQGDFLLFKEAIDLLLTGVVRSSIEGINSIINFLHKTNAKLKGYKRLQYLIFLNKLRQNPRYKKLIIPNKYGND